MPIRHAFALVAGLLLSIAICAQQNNQPSVPDSIMRAKKDLDSVTVTGRRSLTTRKPDRTIINIEGSYLANGNSGLEVLKRSPGLWVDQNGKITMKGGQGVSVMINDVVQRMSSEELAEYLRTLKSEEISRIEVISNPQSEYEAAGAGGIVHIVLKKARKDGYNGFLNTQYRQQGRFSSMLYGGALNYKIKKLYLATAYNYTKDTKPLRERTDMRYPDKSSYHNYSNRIDVLERHRFKLGVGYDLSRNHFIDLQYQLTPFNWVNDFKGDIEYRAAGQTATGTSTTLKYRHNNSSNATLNYVYRIDSLGSRLSIIADYNGSNKTEQGFFEEHYTALLPDTLYINQIPAITRVYSAQANLTRIIDENNTLRSGLKYVSLDRDNQFRREEFTGGEWKPNASQNRQFLYNEALYMGYSSLERIMGRTNVKAGLRAEYTQSNGNAVLSGKTFERTYFSLFPSFAIVHRVHSKKENNLFFTYSRRINRPELNQLNPDRIPFSSYTAVTGNPTIAPEYAHSVEAGYTHWNNMSATVYITATRNLINLHVYQSADNAIEYVWDNFGNSMQYGINLDLPVQVTKNWQTNNSVSLFHLNYNHIETPVQTVVQVKTTQSIIIPSLFDVELDADYRSPYRYPAFATPSQFYLDLGFSKRLLKKHLVVKLYCTDVFNNLRELETTRSANAETIFYRKRPTRTVSLSLTYNFSGGLKFTNRKVESGSGEERRAGS